jgi:PAS domain S-box-containing protein
MSSSPSVSADGVSALGEVLWEDDERVFRRSWHQASDGTRRALLAVLPAGKQPTPASLQRLAREHELKDTLDGAWAVRPFGLVRKHSGTTLLLEYREGVPLHLVGRPMKVGRFLRVAIALSKALGRLHERGLIHKDIKPANVLVNTGNDQVWLMGFGVASRLPRERQSPGPPEFLEGTLAYMSPEQTGRMNRSIDSRSDLYSLGVTLYELLTGRLPFTAAEPMEWVHCHIAREPLSPAEQVGDLPRPLCSIIMKLLAKTAEERYQTAAGVEADLRHCLHKWEREARIADFPLGRHDTADQLLLPEKLYGREAEIGTLVAAFDRIVAGGRPELVLISGYAGIGKSSVVNELHRVLVPPRALFASGKFDQYKRDIPYATLAQAFQSIVRPLLSKSEAELDRWREALSVALGPNGQLMVDLVPELRLIIGEQPSIPTLPLQDAQRRFQLVFRRFIGVFARPEHPLALFLDDLQWLDVGTLEVLEDLLTGSDVRHLMLIGAYRDNEVNSAHPLMRKLRSIRKAGAIVQEIVLAPLVPEDLGRLIGDSLRCETERTATLAQVVHDKTAGNPFFAIQFISSLAEEKLLTFDHSKARWSWDSNRIRTKGYTDNVVDLMVGKLSRLSIPAQKSLQQLACLGSRAEFELLKTIFDNSYDELHTNLREAVLSGLLLQQEGAFCFLHDRVQEAAYSLIPESARAASHLRIGRLLAARIAPAGVEEKIFEIVNHLNRGSALISSREERQRTARLNFIAGRRAKISTAYASALKYLAAGRALLTKESWNDNYELIFDIELDMAECELLTADMAMAENRLSMLAKHAKTAHHIAAVARARLTLYTTLDRSDRAVEVCLEYLRRLGTDWSPHPTRDEVRREYDQIWSLVGNRQIEELINLPLMINREVLDVFEVLTEVVTPALFTDENLCSIVICRMVNLSLEHGNCDGSCFAYVWFAIIAGPRFGNYRAGSQFGRLGYELVEKRGLKRFQARTYMSFGDIVIPWVAHVQTGRELVRRAFESANQSGDLTFAAYSCNHLNTNLLAAGDQLVEVQREAENGLRFAQKVRFGLVTDHITAQLCLIQTLRGLKPKFGYFDDEGFDEGRFECHLASNPALAELECWYSIRKLQARFFAGYYESAVEASLNAQRLLWTSPSQFETAEFRFYAALSHAALLDSAASDQKQWHFEAVVAHHRHLEEWAEHCPENFENRAALVGAEIARAEGRLLDAEHLYEKAIRSAHGNGFVHNEAVANELAGRFYSARGFEKIAQTYLRDARYCYLRWGAEGKVSQLDQLYPDLRQEEQTASPSSTIRAPLEHIDFATVMKVSQAVSGEIVLEKLIDTLMRAAIEHAGAERGLLILEKGRDYRIEAEATTRGNDVAVNLRQVSVTSADLPEAVFHYVVRTKETVLLHDATVANAFSADAYIAGHHARSILCLPLLKQTRLIGVLYLENNLAAHVFTAARMSVLGLLASEAAISLENTRLYSELQEREAKVRRLVSANIIGIFIWDVEGRIVDANDAFLQIVGQSRDDLESGRLRWRDLTPLEWREADDRRVAALAAKGTAPAYEKEYLRKDGSRVPVLVGAANFEGAGKEGVGFVLDLTDRKRAEEAVREGERRYREVQMELAHAGRVATMGQLSASIAHEVNQPISAAITNASVGVHWLGVYPPDLEKARQALGRTVQNVNRASEVLERIHGFIKKAPPRKECLEINDAILEVIGLIRSEAKKNGVSVGTQLADELPLINGDRVQLQQVILNLIMNAIEAMSSVGEGAGARDVVITTSRTEPEGVLVEVRDSGPGLVSTDLERVFDAFYSTKPRGLGMGLSICRSIIEAHEGALWAAANEPRGAVFLFTLPAHPEGIVADTHVAQ